MKRGPNDKLKFKIGEEYGIWEFELNAIPPYEIMENGLTYQIYEYIGEPIFLFQCPISTTLLFFNTDILQRVIHQIDLKFKSKVIESFRSSESTLKLTINNRYLELVDEFMK